MVALGAGALLLSVLSYISASSAAPLAAPAAQAAAASSSYWLANIKHQGSPAFGNSSSYQVFRNVITDGGAKGDGVSDDTDAINNLIASGNRCGEGCDSSTTTPAIIYFPPGTYVVSAPIVQYYYTQFIGDPTNLPTLKASASFTGMAVIDADPYIPGGNGANWYTNQNNFYRQVRNFVIDTTAQPAGTASAGIHWQVGQATSLQNIRFEMTQGGDNNKQQGIFMDNGSGGFMTDLVFNGGNIGAFLGNQQFTTRNMTFNNCNTAIFMNWNWLWTLKSISINNCKLGVDMANAPSNQTVGSVLLMDTKFTNTPIGVNTSFTQDSVPTTGGTLIVDNVDFTGCSTAAIQGDTGSTILAGGKVVTSWAQGNAVASGSAQSRVQGDVTGAPAKPSTLTGDNGFFERAKPQYETLASSSFTSLKSAGAKGDGKTDDTEAIQNAINNLGSNILFVDHGAYLVTKTITIPASSNVKIVGEIWPMFMATGTAFSDQSNPIPMFQVGKTSGEQGTFEMSDCIITTQGPAPGAILMEWNIAETSNGAAGLWDTHFRVGGFAGSELQSDKCSKNPDATHDANSACIGSFMSLHLTKSSSGYFENVWLWTADHELDLSDHNQVDIYNGRGMLVESQGPVWLYGTASEHSQLVQYQFSGAKDIFYGLIQTETPYYQPNPPASTPFTANTKYNDPVFSNSTSASAWAVRILNSQSIWGYGSGTYSFFSNYDQTCLATESCQNDIFEVDSTSTDVNLFGISTKASVNMITQDGKGLALDADNRDNFCATLSIFAQA